ncbi:MAG: hypothetical protein HZB51_25305 [Chloroflexi bacterium]|nr:hypothetical protein [Chloroflexota bacterium]
MRRLPHPMPGSKETRFDFRSYPSLAPDVVAGLQDLPKGAARSRGESNGTGVRVRQGWKDDDTGHEMLGCKKAPCAPDGLGL